MTMTVTTTPTTSTTPTSTPIVSLAPDAIPPGTLVTFVFNAAYAVPSNAKFRRAAILMYCTYGNQALTDITEHASCIGKTKAILVDAPAAAAADRNSRKARTGGHPRAATTGRREAYLLQHGFDSGTVSVVPGAAVVAAVLATPSSVATELLGGPGLLTAFISGGDDVVTTTASKVPDNSASTSPPPSNPDGSGDDGEGSGEAGGPTDNRAVEAAAESKSRRKTLVSAIAGASIALLLIVAVVLLLSVRGRPAPSAQRLAAHQQQQLLGPGGKLVPASGPMTSPYQLMYRPTGAGSDDEYLAVGSAATHQARRDKQPTYAAPAAVLAGYNAGPNGGGVGGDHANPGADDDYVTIVGQAGDARAAREHVSKYLDPAPVDDWQAVQAILLQDHGGGYAVNPQANGGRNKAAAAAAAAPQQQRLPPVQEQSGGGGSGSPSRLATVGAEDEWNFMHTSTIQAEAVDDAGDNGSFRSGRTGSVVSKGEVVAAARKASAAARASEAALAGSSPEPPISWISQLQQASTSASAGGGGGAFDKPPAGHFYPANTFGT